MEPGFSDSLKAGNNSKLETFQNWKKFRQIQPLAKSIIMEFQEVELRAPQNHGELPLFSSLIKSLFNPLLRDFTALSVATRKRPQELREEVIGTFIAKWKANVGNDIYPAFRLILPEQDSERQMYGLKEKALGKLIIKVVSVFF